MRADVRRALSRSANLYRKLIKAGRRVAICDQTSEPQQEKLVSRDITQIVARNGKRSDLLRREASELRRRPFTADSGIFGFAYADLSTGEFRITQWEDRQSLLDQLARVRQPNMIQLGTEGADWRNRSRA